MDELLKEYTELVGKVANANYTDTDKDIPRIVELREEIDRRLTKIKHIEKCDSCYVCQKATN